MTCVLFIFLYCWCKKNSSGVATVFLSCSENIYTCVFFVEILQTNCLVSEYKSRSKEDIILHFPLRNYFLGCSEEFVLGTPPETVCNTAEVSIFISKYVMLCITYSRERLILNKFYSLYSQSALQKEVVKYFRPFRPVFDNVWSIYCVLPYEVSLISPWLKPAVHYTMWKTVW
jgi:hypothetical protein